MAKALEPIPDYGDLMTIEKFAGCVKSGMFIDYDGYGNWATETHILSDDEVRPSKFRNNPKTWPKGATHICWYNR